VFVPLQAGVSLPLGTIIDVRNGRIRLTSAPDASGRTETAEFYGGIFKVTQIPDPNPRSRDVRAGARAAASKSRITQLTLVGRTLKQCRAAKGSARAAAKRKTVRHLWGNGKGRFQTKGSHSAATVAGTKWEVGERCDGTLTRVEKGVVVVHDFVRKRYVRVKAGHTYIAPFARRR
jgi:hypothetical protein